MKIVARLGQQQIDGADPVGIYRRKVKGQSLVTFALGSVILLMVVLGIIELSGYAMAQGTVNNAAAEGSRYAIMRPYDVLTQAEATVIAGDKGPSYIQPLVVNDGICSVIGKTQGAATGINGQNVNVSVWYQRVGADTPVAVSMDPASPDYYKNVISVGNTVVVEANYKGQFITPFLQALFPSGYTLTSRSARTITNDGGDSTMCGLPTMCHAVSWILPNNVSVAGNGITKSGGKDGDWDAGASSSEKLMGGDGYTQFTISAQPGNYMGGLSRSVSHQPGSLDFGFSIDSTSGNVDIVDGGRVVSRESVGANYKVAIESGVAQYYIDDRLVYTSSNAPQYPLRVDTGVTALGTSIASVVLCGSEVLPDEGTPTPTPVACVPANWIRKTLVDARGNTIERIPIPTSTPTFTPSPTATNTSISTPTATATSTPSPCGPVGWKNAVNVNSAANSDVLLKTAGTDGIYDAGAASVQSIPAGNNGYVSGRFFNFPFTSSANQPVAAFGLSNGDTDQSLGDIDYAIVLSQVARQARLEIWENGVVKWGPTTTPIADLFNAVYKISVEGGVVKYYAGSLLLYTSTAAPKYPLLVDTAIARVNAGVATLMMCTGAPPPIEAGCIVPTLTNTGGSVRIAPNDTVIKTFGLNGGWDAGTSSTESIAAGTNGSVSANFLELNYITASDMNLAAFGLSNGDSDKSLADIDFAIALRQSGGKLIAEIYENGVLRPIPRTSSAVPGDPYNTRYMVTVEGGRVKYYAGTRLMYVSTQTPTFPLIMDTSIARTNSGFSNIRMCLTQVPPPPPANCSIIAWQNDRNVTWADASNVLIKTSGDDGMWDAGASSVQTIESGSNGYVEGSLYRGPNAPDVSGGVIGLSNGDPDTEPQNIDYGWLIRSDGTQVVATVFERGVDRLDIVTNPYNNRYRVAVEDGIVKYYAGDQMVYTSTVPPTYPLRIDTSIVRLDTGFSNVIICVSPPPTPPTCAPILWANLNGKVNVSTSNTNPALLYKSGGTDTVWDAGATSSATIAAGDGSVQAQLYLPYWVHGSVSNEPFMAFGLSNGDTDQTLNDIDYAIGMYKQGPQPYITVWEHGVQKIPGRTFSNTAIPVFKVAVENGVVKYYMNTTLLYTSTTPPTYPLLMDVSIAQMRTGIANAKLCIAPQQCQAANLQNGINANPLGDSAMKTGGVDGSYDAGASSSQAILSGSGAVEGKLHGPTKDPFTAAFGLGVGDTDASLGDLEYGIVQDGNRGLIVEGGKTQLTFSSVADKLLRLEVGAGTVKYYVDGALIYTSSKAPSYPLVADISFATSGSNVTNVRICGTDIGSLPPFTPTPTVEPRANAVSDQAISSGYGHVEVTADSTTTQRKFGLARVSDSPGSVRWGFVMFNDGTYQLMNETFPGGRYEVGDTLRVAVTESDQVVYSINGIPIYTSPTSATRPVLLSGDITTVGGKVANAYVCGGDLVGVPEWTPTPGAPPTATPTFTPVAPSLVFAAMDAEKPNTGKNAPLDILITLTNSAGTPVRGAQVTAQVSAGKDAWSGDLVELGAGVYQICNVGSFASDPSDINIHLDATLKGYPSISTDMVAKGGDICP